MPNNTQPDFSAPERLERVADLVEIAGRLKASTVVVAGGDRVDDLRLVESARDHGIVDRIILVGNVKRVEASVAEVGIEIPSGDIVAAETDDAVAAASRLTDADAGVWGLYSPVQFWEFYKKAAQNGCNFFNEDKTEATINTPACVETLETMISFIDEHRVMPSDAEMGGVSDGDMFTAGNLAMTVTGIWMFAAFEGAPFEWDIQVEPGMQEQATHFFANAVSVFAATKHPQEAWEWAQFFTSAPEMAQIRVNSGWELAALDNPAFFEDYLQLSPPANRPAVFDSLKYSIVPPVIERQNEMQDIVNSVLDLVKLGQLTPQEALDQAKVEIEELLR